MLLETKADSDIDALVDEYMIEYGAQNVKYITETSRRDLKKALVDSAEESVDLEKRISSLLASSSYRGALIARTETHAASTFASANAVEELSVKTGTTFKKAWVAAQDERTRETHAAMNADEYIDFNDMFQVGDSEGDRPGDPNLPPEELINCRCVAIYEEEEFAE